MSATDLHLSGCPSAIYRAFFASCPSPYSCSYLDSSKAIALFVVKRYFFGIVKVDGDSMYPTLKDGEYVVMKITDDVEVGDIIILHVDYEYGMTSEDLAGIG